MSFRAWVVPSNLPRAPYQVTAELYGTNGITWMGGDMTPSYAYGDDWSTKKEDVVNRLKVLREQRVKYLELQASQFQAQADKLKQLIEKDATSCS